MAIWGIGPGINYLVPKPSMGRIFDEKISQEEFNDTVVRWARVFFRDSKGQVSQEVWQQMALVHLSKKMGVYVTNEELAQEIQRLFPFGQEMFSNREGYQRMIGSIFRMTEYQFEKTIREFLLAQKLRFLLKDSIKITKEEAFQRYAKENEQVKIKYAALPASDLIDSVEIEEEEINSFYDQHSGNFANKEEGIWGYKEPEKVKLEYVIASYSAMQNEITISDEEILTYYEENKDALFKEVVSDIQETGETPDDKEKTTSTEPQFRPLDDVKGQILVTLKRQESEALANKKIGDADNEIYEMINNNAFVGFGKLSEKFGLSYVVPTNPNDGTNYFTRKDLDTVILGLIQLPQLVFERDVNDPSPPISSPEGPLMFRVLEKIAPQTPPFEEVRDKVAEDLRREKAFKNAQALAEKCLEKIRQSTFEEGVKSIEDEAGEIEIVETDYFKRPGIIGENSYMTVVGQDKPELATSVFSLEIGESTTVAKEKGERVCYLVTLVDRKKSAPAEFEKATESIMTKYLTEKQFSFLLEWEPWLNKKTQLGNEKN
ncbi:MAG: peptidylprolyl isomerase [Candidatus Scalindua sp.]|nr:MAG: peptidylprolyl isomerase [Candidatus Scalindua sp.]